MIPTAEWRRQQALSAVERFHRRYVDDQFTLTRAQAKELTDDDGPAPAPSVVVGDEITAACERLLGLDV